jgi:hypothetical protein
MSRVSSLTSADVARMESQPSPCPRTCDGLLRLLATYQKLLTVLFGTQCKHFLEVRTMRRMLVEKYHQYEQLPAESIAQLLWNVHVDARWFFSTPLLPDGTLPQSQLRCANAWLVDSGSIKRIENWLGTRSSRRRYDGLDASRHTGTRQPQRPSAPGGSYPSCPKQESHCQGHRLDECRHPSGDLHKHQGWNTRRLFGLVHPWEMCQPTLHLLARGVCHRP